MFARRRFYFGTSRIAFVIALGTLWLAESTLWACPGCKEGLLENGQAGVGLARGFELSIYLLLGAPLLVLSSLAAVFYFQIRAARRAGSYPELAQVIAQAEAHANVVGPRLAETN